VYCASKNLQHSEIVKTLLKQHRALDPGAVVLPFAFRMQGVGLTFEIFSPGGAIFNKQNKELMDASDPEQLKQTATVH